MEAGHECSFTASDVLATGEVHHAVAEVTSTSTTAAVGWPPSLVSMPWKGGRGEQDA